MMLCIHHQQAQKTFRLIFESIPTSTTEYRYKRVGAGPECLSTFPNFQNNDEWFKPLTLIGVYSKEQGHYVETERDIGTMEPIAGKSELNMFNVLSKESYEEQVIQKKKAITPKKQWFIKLGCNNQAKNFMKTIPKDQYTNKWYHFLVKTPSTSQLDKSQKNMVKELVGLAWFSIEQKQLTKDKENDRDVSSDTAAKSKIEEAKEKSKMKKPKNCNP
jgi:hypothetical protein